eukprot:3482391-Rhodomonas_salina.3
MHVFGVAFRALQSARCLAQHTHTLCTPCRFQTHQRLAHPWQQSVHPTQAQFALRSDHARS